MQQVRLGRTGLKVSRICLGTLTFGLQSDEETSRAILGRAADAGVTFLDTADAYPALLGRAEDSGKYVGRSEEIIGRWLAGRREEFVVATKAWAPTGPSPNDRGSSRRHLLAAVEASLRRLQTDWIDLYQLHAPDPDTPIEETLAALDGLVRAGKVRYIGCCNFLAYQLARALGRSEALLLTGFHSVQPRYNLVFREIERELRSPRQRTRTASSPSRTRWTSAPPRRRSLRASTRSRPCFVDGPATPSFVAEVAQAGIAVTPTLTVLESLCGLPTGTDLAGDPRLNPYLRPAALAALRQTIGSATPHAPQPDLRHARRSVQSLADAGVRILAGTDAGVPGTAHGASLHRELELLTQCGLTATQALAAATAVPAACFGLSDRGRVAPGRQADLVLVRGDPTTEITHTRNILAVWRRGQRIDRGGKPGGNPGGNRV
jgi:diketogulonate reductase-like aldo/keto reductase